MKIPYILLLFAFLLITHHARAYDNIDDEIRSALGDVYNLDFQNAESKFKAFQKSHPDDVRGYFYESILYFYKALPARDEQLFEKFIELSNNVIEKCEDVLEKNENDYDALYYKGLSHSYRSLLMLSLNKSLLQAASDGNSGYRILESLIEKKPDYYDAYMGLGLYKIAIGFVPEKFQWLLSLIGFEGDLNEGIRLLQLSMQNGKYTRTDSKAFLVLFLLNEKEENDQRSLELSRQLTEEFPESPWFRFIYSSLLLQNGHPDDAIRVAKESLEINRFSFQDEIKKAAAAVMGSAYFRKNDYKEAIKSLEEFTKYIHKDDRYNVYLFTLASSYELEGNRERAVENYKRVRDKFINERDGELDRYFFRLAQHYINNPMNDFDKFLIKGFNLRESGHVSESVKYYEDNQHMMAKAKSDDDRIKYYFDSGLAYVYNKNESKAEENFLKCISLKPENELWLIPFSYFELGKMYLRKGNKLKAEEMFEKIFEYDDFNFESFLEMRLANFKSKH